VVPVGQGLLALDTSGALNALIAHVLSSLSHSLVSGKIPEDSGLPSLKWT
jgi:hypothetical protein